MNKAVLTKHGVKAVFLFIAELNGFKSGTVSDKTKFGKRCWLANTLHDIDTTSNLAVINARTDINDAERAELIKAENQRAEDDRAELHENIWLQRCYDNLDKHFKTNNLIKRKALTDKDALKYILAKHNQATHLWDVPIELDASASMLQYMGILLNDIRLTSMTNVIGKDLSDPWAFDGIPRKQFKKAATPMLYGSSRACHELWQDGGFNYTLDQVKLFNEELASGAFGAANAFKDFIINHCKPSETMKVRIRDEYFEVECNRFKHIGETTTQFDIYDTETGRIRTLHHTETKKVADLDQFRRYFVTLLIHNLDSQVADKVIGKVMDNYGWGIDIHDAFIIHPNAAKDVRKWYTEELDNIYNNRTNILVDFFTSIGIGPEAQKAWSEVVSKVKPIEGKFSANPMALK